MAISTTTAFAFANGAVSNTALALTDAPFSFTQAQLDRASRARITIATQPVRYRYDGADPTAAIGHYLAVDAETEIVGNENIQNLRLIRATGVDGAASITLEE